jgi:AraC family transcriptional regulator
MAPDPKTLVGSRGRIGVLNLDGEVTEHAHPQAQALIKIGGPDRVIAVAEQRHVLSDDILILLPPWVPHAGLATTGGNTSVLSVNLGFLAPAMQTGRDNAICRPIDPKLRRAADDLRDRLTRGEASAGDADDLLRSFSEACPGNYFGDGPRAIDFRIRRVVEHIRSAPAHAQHVAAWVDVAGLSRQHFFQLFRDCIGVTPRLYANSLRLECALDRLSRSTIPIHKLSNALGFRAPSHFTRFFVDNFGSTPRAYRRGAHVLAD